jgi:hypothetical protein
MSAFPGSPRLIKGALVGVGLMGVLESTVVFQYNPDTLTRRLEPRNAKPDGEKGDVTRLSGPPKETITVSIEIDATDQLEEANVLALATGIGPTLAALELMLYPKSSLVVANAVMSALGTIEVLPAEGPLILFVWGPTRVVPVQVTGLTITEDAHDQLLNPIRAKAELTLMVLSYNDLQVTSLGRALFLVHQVTAEALALSNAFNSVQSVGAALKF